MAEKSEYGNKHHAYNRKMKSLGLLCSNFVSLCIRDNVVTVGLDDAAMKLGVERRRIYDIVNVMQSVGVLARKEKNRYLWIGFRGIPDALLHLKEEAVREQNGASVERSAAKEDLNDDDWEGKSCDNDTAVKPRSAVDRKEKSLGQLTQNFVKLLLTTKMDMVSLDEAARLLLGDGQDSSRMRNPNAAKVRRLYDIANVLSSLNLIEKTHQSDSKKPAFRWLGTKGACESAVTVAPPRAGQKSSRRVFGMELTNVDVKRRRLASSVDKKPDTDQKTCQDLREGNMAAQRQLQGSKSFVFGPFNPPKLQNEEVVEQEVKQFHYFENSTSSLRPTFHNQALHDLFTHYLEAYNSWFDEIAGGSNNMQQSFRNPFPIQHT